MTHRQHRNKDHRYTISLILIRLMTDYLVADYLTFFCLNSLLPGNSTSIPDEVTDQIRLNSTKFDLKKYLNLTAEKNEDWTRAA